MIAGDQKREALEAWERLLLGMICSESLVVTISARATNDRNCISSIAMAAFENGSMRDGAQPIQSPDRLRRGRAVA
jgi:hypothetical protein